MIGLVAFTVTTSWDWFLGIGFNPLTLPAEFRDSNPAMVQGLYNFTDPQWRADYFGRIVRAFTDTSNPWLISFDSRIGRGLVETVQIAVLATVVGAAVALPISILNTRLGAPNRAFLGLSKFANNANRAIPDIVWATVFVILVGIGPLAGVLALIMFSIGVVVKLTSDIVDGIDPGPIEAARAAGASHLATLRTAALPQILPGYASFSLYAFEINLRGAVVLGFVGAGGIGQAFDYYWSRLDFEGVSAVVFVFLVVVVVLERISLAVRRRLV